MTPPTIHELRDAVIDLVRANRLSLGSIPLLRAIDALDAALATEAEATRERRAADDRERAEQAAIRKHNAEMIAKHGPALRKIFNDASRHLTAYELGGTGTTRTLEIDEMIRAHLGISDRYSHRVRAREPYGSEVDATCRTLRLKWSRAHESFGPLTAEDVEKARSEIVKLRAELAPWDEKQKAYGETHKYPDGNVRTDYSIENVHQQPLRRRINDYERAIEHGALASASADVVLAGTKVES